MAQTGLWLSRGGEAPCGETGSFDGKVVDATTWLDEQCASKWEITQSDYVMSCYGQTLIILTAGPKELEQDDWDDVQDSFDKWPRC